MESVVKPLAKAFSSLDAKQLQRLLWHTKNGTELLCGRDKFVSGSALSPEVAACTKCAKLTYRNMVRWGRVYQFLCETGEVITIPAVYTALHLKPYRTPAQALTTYSKAIGEANQSEVRAAIRLACDARSIG